MNARPPTSLLLKGFGLLGIVPAILSSPSASEAQGGQEVRYQNPIVFARTHLDAAGPVTRRSKLWVMEDDGSGLRQITFGATYDDHPSFYADQRHVLYSEFPNNVLDRGDGARLVSLDIYTGEREIVHEVPERAGPPGRRSQACQPRHLHGGEGDRARGRRTCAPSLVGLAPR